MKQFLSTIILLIFHVISVHAQTTVSEVSFTYEDTDFAFFQTSPGINQPDAQTECINWGGNLATIKSRVEDSLLLYSSPDLDTIFTCHIGLNKIGGTEFVWIDGSSSSYRNWGMNFPSGDANHYCVRYRYRDGGLVSQGWLNDPCTTERNCYFCSKPGTSNGCDLIYDGSCYKVFEVSTPINWLDAQSSCAIWGGDLTSITTERENDYLNTLINSSVGNCWIGLNDRGVQGTYTWIDGTTVSYTNWTSTPPNVANSDCVRINNTGNGMWECVSCDTILNAFLCKRDSSNDIPIVGRFGRITDGAYEFEELTDNTFFYESQTLVCGSDGGSVVWRYSQNSDLSGAIVLPETSNYVDFSWLYVNNTMQGYYRCTMSNSIYHTVGVFDTVKIDSFDDPLQQVNYTVDSPVSLLYYPASAIGQTSVSDRDIHWTTDTVIDGEEKSYSSEYPNPADLNVVFSNVGGGVQTFSCFYRMSPVTLLGSLQLILKDTATITVYYEGYSKIFSDVNNPIFPSAQEVTILTGTKYIVLTCNLPECVWMISEDPDFITVDSYIIPEISDSYSRTFSLIRMSSNGVSYSTAHVHIHAQVVTQSPTNSPLVAVVVIVLVLILFLGTIAILIPLCIYFYMKKRNVFKHPKPSYPPKKGNSGYEYISGLHLPSKEYINLPDNPNSQCMAIRESSMIPQESENEQMRKGYTNLADESAYTSTYEQINERTMKVDTQLNPDIPYEGYVPMTCVEKEKRFVSRSIPTKEFPVAYQQYVSSGIEKDSLFSIEYTNLNEDTQINVELETNEALKVENILRNPMKNIFPFDKNRVVLQSTHFNCGYINASYINENQFIASIHPTRETHRDFLQMIYQTEASMVIMLTTRKEKAKIISGISNRVCYWPKKDENIECKPFLTTLINSTESAAFIKQEISVKNTLERKEHTFIHCISPLWNEDSTVSEMSPTLALLSRILKQIQDMPSKPIIIHCEDGISKTGILLTGVNSVNELTHKKSINIFNSVKNLRRQRMKMVPTVACYTTCYSLMNEYCSIHL